MYLVLIDAPIRQLCTLVLSPQCLLVAAFAPKRWGVL